MSQLPYLTRGKIGALSHEHINTISEIVDSDTIEDNAGLPDDDELKASLFIAKILGRSNEDDAFNTLLAWSERCLDEAVIHVPGTPPDNFAYFDGPRSSSAGVPGISGGGGGGGIGEDEPGRPIDRFKEPAIYLMPPQGLMLHIPSKQGPTRQVWIPAPSVLRGKITTVHPGPPFNVVYSVESIDGSIVAFEITPIDRWNSTDYLPRAVNDTCLLLLDKEKFDKDGIPLPIQLTVSMVAWETPDFEQCGGSPAAAGGGGGIGAGFTFGVTL